MMDLFQLVTPAFSTAAGAWLTYRFWLRQKHRELVERYDVTTRETRVRSFQEAWRLLEPFSLYAPRADVMLEDVSRLARRLRHWYFGAGGLVMTESTRDIYFLLHEALLGVLRSVPRSVPEQASRPRVLGVAGGPEEPVAVPVADERPAGETEVILRSREEPLDHFRAKKFKKDWRLPELDPGILARRPAFVAWQKLVRARVASRFAGNASATPSPMERFLLVQCHASWLRSALAHELHSRDPSPLG